MEIWKKMWVGVFSEHSVLLHVQHDIVCNYCFKLTEKLSVGNFKVDKSEKCVYWKETWYVFSFFDTARQKKTKNVASFGFWET